MNFIINIIDVNRSFNRMASQCFDTSS